MNPMPSGAATCDLPLSGKWRPAEGSPGHYRDAVAGMRPTPAGALDSGRGYTPTIFFWNNPMKTVGGVICTHEPLSARRASIPSPSPLTGRERILGGLRDFRRLLNPWQSWFARVEEYPPMFFSGTTP